MYINAHIFESETEAQKACDELNNIYGLPNIQNGKTSMYGYNELNKLICIISDENTVKEFGNPTEIELINESETIQ